MDLSFSEIKWRCVCLLPIYAPLSKAQWEQVFSHEMRAILFSLTSSIYLRVIMKVNVRYDTSEAAESKELTSSVMKCCLISVVFIWSSLHILMAQLGLVCYVEAGWYVCFHSDLNTAVQFSWQTKLFIIIASLHTTNKLAFVNEKRLSLTLKIKSRRPSAKL